MFGDPVRNERGWPTVTLPDLSTKFNQGVNTTTEKVEYSENVDIPVIRAGDITSGILEFSNCVYVDESNFKKIKEACRPKNGDILYANIGARLGVGCIVEANTTFGIAWNVMRIQVKESVNRYFFLYLLNHPSVRDLVVSLSKSATVPFISGERLSEVPFISPPQEMQSMFSFIVKMIIDSKRKTDKNLSDELFFTISEQAFK
jgi:type I restriction enzyme S subunit